MAGVKPTDNDIRTMIAMATDGAPQPQSSKPRRLAQGANMARDAKQPPPQSEEEGGGQPSLKKTKKKEESGRSRKAARDQLVLVNALHKLKTLGVLGSDGGGGSELAAGAGASLDDHSAALLRRLARPRESESMLELADARKGCATVAQGMARVEEMVRGGG